MPLRLRLGKPGALASGLSSLKRGRLILLLAGTTLALGVLAAAPLGPSLRERVAGTLAGDAFARNDADLAPALAFDFLREERPAVSGALSAARWGALVGLFLQIFFVGGIVETLGRSPGTVVARGPFFFGARRHFGHNLKCFFVFLAASLVLVGGWLAVAVGAGQAMFEGAAPHSGGPAAWLWVTLLGALLLFGVLSLLYDFARAARRRYPSIGAVAGFREARRRLRGRWIRGLGLLGFWLVAGAVSVGALFALAWGQRTPTGAAVFVNLLLVAGVVTARSAVRVGAWGSMLALFDASEPPPPPPPPIVPAVPVPILPEDDETIPPAPAPASS
jgi:hypothetical protein